jgi:hypothetical protein
MGHLVPVLVATIAGHRHFHAWHLHDLLGNPEPDCWCRVPAAGGLEANQTQLSTCRLTASSIFGTWVFVGQRLGYGYVADSFRSDIPEA